MREAVALASGAKVFFDLSGGADQKMRHLQHVLGFEAHRWRKRRGQRLPVVRDAGEKDREPKIDRLHAVARGFLDPAELLVGCLGHPGAHEPGVNSALVQVVVHMDDIRLPRRQAQHATASATQEERRVWLLDRRRSALDALDRVVLAGECELSAREELLDDLDGFLEALDSSARRVVWNARLLVVRQQPSGADAQLETAI